MNLSVTDHDGATDTDSMDVAVKVEPIATNEITVDNPNVGSSKSSTESEPEAPDEYVRSSLYNRTFNYSATWTPY